MRKSIFIIAATASIMIGCSSNDTFKEVINNEDPQAIGFAAYSEKPTKTDDHNTLEFFYPTFNVYGWKTYNGLTWDIVFSDVTNEYFAASGAEAQKKVTTNGSVIYQGDGNTPKAEWGKDEAGWYYEGIRYWDKFATDYQFCAYAPISASNKVVCTEEGVIKIGDDETGTNPKGTITVDQTNLMAVPNTTLAYKGFVSDYMTAKATDETSPVGLVFTHELAKINIKLLLDASITTKQDVVVKEITITGLKNTSYYTSEEDKANPSNGFVSGWKEPTTAISYSVNGVNEGNLGYKMNGSTPGTDKFDTYYVMERLMIPQAINKTNPASQLAAFDNGAYIYVKYTIGTEEFSGHWGLANLFDTSENNSYKLLGGNEYTLTITVGPNPIYFKADVTPWTEVNGAFSF